MKKSILGLMALACSVRVLALTETIPQIPNTILAPASDDYFETGGNTNGSAKILITTFPIVVQSRPALSALNMSGRANSEIAICESSVGVLGDGAASLYYYSSSSGATVDGITVLSATGGGRWLMLATGQQDTATYNVKGLNVLSYQASLLGGLYTGFIQTNATTVTGSGAISLGLGTSKVVVVNATGNITSMTSNVAAQSTENTIIINNTSVGTITVAWPSGWHQMNPLPTSMIAGQTAVIRTVLSFPAGLDTNIYATLDPWTSIGTSGSSILYGNGSGGVANVVIGSGLSFSGGTLTSTATSTAGSAILYGNGSGGFANATIGTGLAFSGGILSSTATSTTGSSILSGNGLGGFSNVSIGSGLSFSAGTLSLTGTYIGYATAALTMSAMRGLSAAVPGWVNGTIVHLAGYYNQEDGGGGYFVWDSSDTTADNGGTVIQVTGVTTGRLHRVDTSTIGGTQLPNGTLNVEWFGAIPDVVRDCTPGITAAFNSTVFSGSNESPCLYFPAGQYLIKTKLALNGSSLASFNAQGDGPNSTIIVCAFPSSDTAMWDLSSFPFLRINNMSFTFQGGSTILPQYLYLHTIAELELSSLRASNFSGTFFNVSGVSAWSKILNINTANVTGTQLLINGSGGVVSDVNMNAGFGAPALWVKSCDALDISHGQFTGAGPYKTFSSCSVTSNSSTFTITAASHGFVAGDWIYIRTATNAGYINKWKIASTTTNTITVNSTANLGADSVTLDTLWSCGYFGGGLCTESSCSNIVFNTGTSAPTGSCGVFLDGYNSGSSSVQGMRFSNILTDYGSTKWFLHGQAGASYDGSSSWLYCVATSTPNYFQLVTASSRVTAGSFSTGHVYVVESAGTTNFVAIGAANNNVGTVFTATGAGSGSGYADTVVNSTLRPGGYVHITSGGYVGFWKIASNVSGVITVNSTINPGTATVVAAEGDVFGSTVMGINISQALLYCNDSFGAIRVEGAISNTFSDLQFYLGTASGSATAAVICDDANATYPTIDNQFFGCTFGDNRQSQLSPLSLLTMVNIDGPQVWGLTIKGARVAAVNNFFTFTNAEGQASTPTPTTSNLDTDLFTGNSVICNIGSSGQSFNTGVQSPVSWDHVSLDTLGMWQGPVNPTQVIPPTGVRFVKLSGKVHWNSSVSPQYVVITQHGTTTCGSVALAGQPFNSQATVDTGVIAVNPGDYFRMECYQTSGSTQTLANSLETALTLTVIK